MLLLDTGRSRIGDFVALVNVILVCIYIFYSVFSFFVQVCVTAISREGGGVLMMLFILVLSLDLDLCYLFCRRFKHMQIRVNAEAAALYRSGAVELEKTESFLRRLLAVQSRLIRRQYALNCKSKSFSLFYRSVHVLYTEVSNKYIILLLCFTICKHREAGGCLIKDYHSFALQMNLSIVT